MTSIFGSSRMQQPSQGWLYFHLHMKFTYIKIKNWTFVYKGTGHLPTSKLRTGHLPTLQVRELDIRPLKKGILDICLLVYWTLAYTKIKKTVHLSTPQIRALDNRLQLNREHCTFAYTKSFLWTFAYSSKMSTGHLPTSKLSTGHLPTAQKMSTGHSQIHPNSSLDICLQMIESFPNHTSSNLLLDLRIETCKAI